MKPKPIVLILIVALVGGTAYFVGKRSSHGGATTQAKKTLYTCGMHPQVIQDHPGNCPICGMKLTPVRKQPTEQASTGGERKIKYWRAPMDPSYISDKPGKSPMGMDLVPVYEDEAALDNTISIDPVTIQDMGLRTMVLTNGPLRRVVRTVATIDYDETALADVTTKFKGWVEKLYVDSVGAQVHRGDPLFEVYSPELYSAQTEFLLAMQAAPGPSGDTLRQTARTKLKFYDISDAQIAELEKTGKAQKTLQVQAPIDGFVTEKMVVEGQMVSAGMNLYRLANLGIVWVQAQIYEQDLPFIKLGQEAIVTLSYLPDRKFRGRVTYIYPTLDPKTRTARVRMEFHNPGYFLKPGMFASVELVSELSPSALLVPNMAVLRSGERNTVFVALQGGKFDPRKVTLGVQAENQMVQVLSGLKAGERVVTSGQFLLDSESQLREAIQKMTEPGKGKMNMQMPANTNAPTEVASTPSDGPVVYVCPMPEHVAIHEDKPGKCPICGMTLIPVMAKPELPKTPPQTSTQDETPLPTLYTCPMASDAEVVSDKPGVCPECGMKLVPTSTVKHGKISEEIWRKEHAQHQH